MLIFELVVALLVVGAVLAVCADKLDIPYPALLAPAGALLAFVPGTPDFQLDPELALTLFVAPVLLDAAYDASPRDLRRNVLSVSSLAVGAVLLTIAAVALVARWRVPEMGWPAALALGAIVAPPDASAATAVLKRLRPPHRVMVILEGESLFNDASALLVYRVAVGAAITGSFSGWRAVGMLLVSCVGGVLFGKLLAGVVIRVNGWFEDVSLATLMQFLCTFGVWMAAERLGLSAILSTVAFAMAAARRAPAANDARRRIASYAVWDIAVIVLNMLAFVLIGLSLRGIMGRIAPHHRSDYFVTAGAIVAAVILVRIGYWALFDLSVRLRLRRCAPEDRPAVLPTPGAGLLIAWCGMRGIVTLAAALALPDGDAPFPQRDLIVFSAFCVVLSTLVVQGMTLRPLLTRLGLEDEGDVARELRVARLETARAALKEMAGDESATILLRREYETRVRIHARDEPIADATGLPRLQRAAVNVQRRTLLALRAQSVIGDDAFHLAEEELDLLELSATARVHPDDGEVR